MRVKILAYIILAMLLSVSVSAFGVGTQYMENRTLNLYPGQTYLFKVELQNKDEQEVTVKVILDSSIATLIGGPEVTIPAKTYDNVQVYFNITVPKTAQLGDTYNINYLVAPVEKGEGQVPLAVQYDRTFKILVVERPAGLPEEQEPASLPAAPESVLAKMKWVLIPLIFLIIMAVAILIWNKSHQMSNRFGRKEPGFSRHSEIRPQATIKHEPVVQSMPIIHPQIEPEHPVQPMQKPMPIKQEKTILPRHYFHLRSGKSLKSLEELYSELRSMNREEFTHHVNPEKNDFANWIAHVLEKPGLAKSLVGVTSKQETMEMIKNELDQR